MSRRMLSYFLALVFASLCLIYFMTRPEKDFLVQVKGGVINPIDLQKELHRRLRQAKIGSREARELQYTIEKVREKASRLFQPAENPGAFLEALADLKTTRDGRRYGKNHKQIELSKARRSAAEFSTQSSLLRFSANDPIAWRERGPGNVSGRVQGVAVDVADPSGNTWFAAPWPPWRYRCSIIRGGCGVPRCCLPDKPSSQRSHLAYPSDLW